ncbi:MAG TPA: hypothetical protein EYP10_07495, partial [Armatimonadetes bacterium]|nr:hypothetical protein [Armatimonadota bacterium]
MQVKELLRNGGFEEGTKWWLFVRGPYGMPPRGWAEAGKLARIVMDDVHSGKRALMLDARGLDHEVDVHSEPFAIEPNRFYRLSSFVKQIAGTGRYKVVIDWRDAHGKHIRYDNDWRGVNRPKNFAFHGGIFRAPENARQAIVLLGVAKGVACIFDDISLVMYPPHPSGVAESVRDGEGRATLRIEPAGDVTVGSYRTFRIIFTVGKSGLPVGSAIQFRRSNVEVRWSQPQVDVPDGDGFLTVRASNGAELFVECGNWHAVPQLTTIRIGYPPLRHGDVIEIIYGDKSRGGKGARVQPVAERGG